VCLEASLTRRHREIAQLLRCSIANSKVQLHQARLKMHNGLFPRSTFSSVA
jgi:DNA-directed RNA polymerase specialized sigma24 family protein